MSDGLRVCHVLNSISGQTIPVDIGVAQLEYTDVTDVHLCAWFNADIVEGENSVTVQSLEAPKNAPAGFKKSAFNELRRTIRGYDVVHSHSNHAGLYTKLAAKREGVPIVSTEHNDHSGFTQKGRVVNGLTNPICDAVTCVSDAVFESFRSWERALIDDEIVTTVYNGVDFSRLSSSDSTGWQLHDNVDVAEEAIIIGNAATLSEQKNQETLIRAISIANERAERPIELVISGSGPRREYLENVIREENVSDKIHLLGYLELRKHVYQMMRSCDVFAMPSRWEGFCVAVLEAMALDTPAVLSDINVFREVYGDVARYHDVENETELAEQLLYFVEHPEECQEYGSKAREHARSYSLEQTAQEYESIYKSLA